MRKRKRVILAAAAFLFASFLVYALHATHEPTCAGHSLSHWVLDAQRPDYDDNDLSDEIAAAFHTIGTNSIPYLLKWIKYESPAWRDHVLTALPTRTPASFMNWVVSPTRLRLAEGTIRVFNCLGSTAAPAIPMLSQIASTPGKPETARRAVNALAAIGTNAIPALLQIITNRAHPQRPAAARFITVTIDPRCPDSARLQETILPHLLGCLTDNQAEASQAAATALGSLAADAQHVVPALTASLETTNRDLCFCAIIALGHFGSNATTAIPVLDRFLHGPDSLLSTEAAVAMSSIAPTVYTNR